MNLLSRLRALPSKPDPDQPTPTWSIVDRKTGVYWGDMSVGIFWTKQAAESARMLLASKYGNQDLRTVRR